MAVDWAAWAPHTITDFDGPPTLLAAYGKVFSKAAVYTVVFLAIWVAILLVLRVAGFPETLGGAKRGTWALKSAMLVHHVTVTPLVLLGMWEDGPIMGMYSCFGCSEVASLMNRNGAQPFLVARVVTPVTLGYFVGDLLLLSQWSVSKTSKLENMLMVFHHVASLIVWPAALYFDWVSRYVLIMLSYEFTNIWLTAIWILSAADMKKSPVYFVVGLIFTVSFVIMRMVGALPQLLAMWRAPPWSREVELQASPGGIHDWCWIFSASLVLPHMLNLFWGCKVVQGFAAVAFKKGGKTKGN